MDLGIANVGLSEADAHRLKTVMVMAITSKHLSHRWVMSEVEDAALIVTSTEVDDVSSLQSTAKKKGAFLALLAGETDEVPTGMLKLPWPIRLESLLALLKHVEKKADKLAKQNSDEPVVAPESDNHLVRLASMLRAGERATATTVWRIEGLSKLPLHISLGEKSFYYGDSLASLRNIDPNKRLEFIPVPVEELHARDGKKPLIMLQWLVGLRAGTFGLFSWIDPAHMMRLKRYPPFHMLHHTPSHRRIAAALARPRTGVTELVRLTGEDKVGVSSFINAANLCGYLITEDVAQRPAASSGIIKAPKRALIQSFRKALGIISANA